MWAQSPGLAAGSKGLDGSEVAVYPDLGAATPFTGRGALQHPRRRIEAQRLLDMWNVVILHPGTHAADVPPRRILLVSKESADTYCPDFINMIHTLWASHITRRPCCTNPSVKLDEHVSFSSLASMFLNVRSIRTYNIIYV